jgi:hypothetical protein
MLEILTFCIERAIVNSLVGFICVAVLIFLFGKLLVKFFKNDWIRVGIYSFVGLVGSLWDYSNMNADEFSKLPTYLFVCLILISFLWMFLITTVFTFSYKKIFRKST